MFALNYKSLTEKEAKSLNDGAAEIRQNRQKEKVFINEIGPRVIGAVIGGHNVAELNTFVSAIPSGVDHDRLVKVIKRICGYKYVDGAFTEKENEGAFNRKKEAYEAFCAGETTLHQLWMGQIKDERANAPVDYGNKLAKDVRAAMEKGGLKLDQVLAIVQAAALAAQAEQKLHEVEEAQELEEAA